MCNNKRRLHILTHYCTYITLSFFSSRSYLSLLPPFFNVDLHASTFSAIPQQLEIVVPDTSVAENEVGIYYV